MVKSSTEITSSSKGQTFKTYLLLQEIPENYSALQAREVQLVLRGCEAPS